MKIMSDSKNKKQEKCLFLIAEKGKWGIKDHLKPFKPVYNGAGWFIEEKHRPQVEQISQQVDMRLIDWPLDVESFEELRRRNRREYINEQFLKTKIAIDGLKATLGIQDINTSEPLQCELRKDLERIEDGKKLIELLEEKTHLQEQIKFAEAEEKIAKIETSALSITPIEKRIESHKEELKKYRGKKYLGLRVKTISEFNEKMLGLRKLILLAAAPNVGKTALTIQLATEVLLTEPDACLVYVSLEMSAEEIFTRVNLYLSGLDFNTYVLGSQQAEVGGDYQHFFSQEELRKIEAAHKEVKQIGDRLQIIDMSSCANLDASILIKYVENLKLQTGCQRAIVIIDYLQVWPVSPSVRHTSDIEADKWRIGEIKKIRDALNKVNQDPVIVISEARKPSSNGDTWGGDLSDIMGSARGSYTPDAALLLNQLSDKELEDLWTTEQMPKITNEQDKNKGSVIREHLANNGIAFCYLKMPKGRDGMKKFTIPMTFYFHKNKFERTNLLDIRVLFKGAEGENEKQYNRSTSFKGRNNR